MPARIFNAHIEAAGRSTVLLLEYPGRNPLLLAIPRSAVPMGKIFAERLVGELDIVMVHKLGAPFDLEFAIGAVDEPGWTYLSEFEDDSSKLIEQTRSRYLAALKSRRAQLTPFLHPVHSHH